jgi:hypothetical protein
MARTRTTVLGLAPALGLAAIGLAACDAGFADPTIVVDLRVLAAPTDPAELVLDFDPMDPNALVTLATELQANPVTLTPLVADPGATRRLQWDLSACAPSKSLRCDAPDDAKNTTVLVGSGTMEDPETTAPVASAPFVIPVNVLEESITADALAGFGGVAVQLQLRVWPEGDDPKTAVYAEKRFVVAPRLPAERVANSNPTLDSLMWGTNPDADPTDTFAPGACGEPGTTPITVNAQQKIHLLPVEPDGVREHYVLPTYEGGTRALTEFMRYAWYVTAGELSSGESGGETDIFGNKPHLDVTWTAPKDPGDVRLWLIMRDERGGTAFYRYCLRVQ